MCMAVPSLVVELREASALVECFGVCREVSTALMTDPIAVGDYVLIRAGRHVVERVDRDRALESLALMEELLSHDELQRDAEHRTLGLLPVEALPS